MATMNLTAEQKANVARLERTEAEVARQIRSELLAAEMREGAKPTFEYTIEGDKSGKAFRTRRIAWNDILD